MNAGGNDHQGMFRWYNALGTQIESVDLTTLSPLMVITPSSNVGIGTITPHANLDVADSFKVGALRIERRDINGQAASSIFTDPNLNNEHLVLGARARTDVVIRRETGDVGIGTTDPQAKLDVNGKINCTVLELTSDRNQKQDFSSVDVRSILDRLISLPIQTWAYTNDAKVRHIGPTAQDFHAAFPDLGSDDKHIAAGDLASVALAAVQALHEELQEIKARLEAKDARIATLEHKLAQMDTLASRLEAVEKRMAQAVVSEAANVAVVEHGAESSLHVTP
jgi:hypothetical protein